MLIYPKHEGINFENWLKQMLDVLKTIGKKKKLKLTEVRPLYHSFISRPILKVQGLIH
jgi:hypothetical protein